eukprot:739972-Rhodomonas_salina.2
MTVEEQERRVTHFDSVDEIPDQQLRDLCAHKCAPALRLRCFSWRHPDLCSLFWVRCRCCPWLRQ